MGASPTGFRLPRGSLLLAALVVLFVGGFAAMGVYFYVMSSGDEIASIVPEIGKPFELRYVSTGEAQRVWIDVTCTSCDPNAVQGTLVASDAAGRELARTQVSEVFAGFSEVGLEDGFVYGVEGHPLFEIPAQPAGAEVFVRGTLTPEPMQIYEIGPLELNRDVPLPDIRSLRLWIAP
jgi:hypothetical protein